MIVLQGKMLASTDILVVCFCVVAGENEELLGIDETPITEIYWIAIDVVENRILKDGEYHIEKWKDETEMEEDDELKEEAKESNDEQKQDVVILEDALMQFEEVLNKLSEDEKTVRLVTENGLHLRQCLHPQTFFKGITLSDIFYKYFDLTMQYKVFKDDGLHLTNLKSIAKDMAKEGYEDLSTPKKRCQFCARVVLYLLKEGHKFTEMDEVYKTLETGMTDGFVDDDTIARARGLPWQVSDVDVADFFYGLNIERGGVALCLNEKGRRNGEALVRFSCPKHREMALRRHKHHLFGRYIEVYKGTAQEFSKIAKGPVSAMQCVEQFLSSGGDVLIRMRGLPFDASIQDILNFFGESPKVHQDKDGVMLVSHPDGSSTGDAFVLFNTEPEGQVALKKHRENIGKRYVELFRSTRAEMQQVLTMYTTVYQIVTPISLPSMPVVTADQALINQQRLLTHMNMSCLRLRGIPFSANEKDILNFLSTHADFVVGSVHIIYNLQGRLSGEAFVQMQSPDFAYKCAKELHLEHMRGRYIEVFQCGVKDMACMLATSLASQFAAQHLNKLSNNNSNNNNNNASSISNNNNNTYHSSPHPAQSILATPHELPVSGRIATPLSQPANTNGFILQNIPLIPIFTNQYPPVLSTLPPPPFMQPTQLQPSIVPGIPSLIQPMIINPESIHVQLNQFTKMNGVIYLTDFNSTS